APSLPHDEPVPAALSSTSYPTAMPWSLNANRPADGGTTGARNVKLSTSSADGAPSDSTTARGAKTTSSGAPGIGLTSSNSDELACAMPTPPCSSPSAVAKLAAGRAVISVVRTESRMKSCTKLDCRKRTSVLAGCTFTSTSCGGISRKINTTGNEVGGIMLRYASASACSTTRSRTSRWLTKMYTEL